MGAGAWRSYVGVCDIVARDNEHILAVTLLGLRCASITIGCRMLLCGIAGGVMFPYRLIQIPRAFQFLWTVWNNCFRFPPDSRIAETVAARFYRDFRSTAALRPFQGCLGSICMWCRYAGESREGGIAEIYPDLGVVQDRYVVWIVHIRSWPIVVFRRAVCRQLDSRGCSCSCRDRHRVPWWMSLLGLWLPTAQGGRVFSPLSCHNKDLGIVSRKTIDIKDSHMVDSTRQSLLP